MGAVPYGIVCIAVRKMPSWILNHDAGKDHWVVLRNRLREEVEQRSHPAVAVRLTND
jgi:hypothetical protein